MGERYYYMPMPVNKDGDGPAVDGGTVHTLHEVWDDACLTVCTCEDERAARHIATLLNDRPIVATQQAGADMANVMGMPANAISQPRGAVRNKIQSSDKPNYQYSAGNHPDDHGTDCRFDFPKGQCIYHQEWRLVATDLADDYHSNHDGWESDWPVEFRIYKNGECVWKGEVEREMEPAFYVL